MIDATRSIDRQREEIEERQRAAAVRENATSMEAALDALCDAIINISARFGVDANALERAYTRAGGLFEQTESEADLALAVANIDKALDWLPKPGDEEAAK